MIVSVTIKPNSKKGPLIEKMADDSLLVYVREAAVDGKANEAMVKMLSKHYKVPKTRITIIRGHTSRQKTIEIK